MNASVPPGWRPSFTAKQSRSIVSGAWARGRKRWGFFRYSSFSSSFTTFRSLFFTASVFSGRTPVGLFLQLDATACPDFPHFRLSVLRHAPQPVLRHAQRPVLRPATAAGRFYWPYGPFCSPVLCGGLLFCVHYPAGMFRRSI